MPLPLANRSSDSAMALNALSANVYEYTPGASGSRSDPTTCMACCVLSAAEPEGGSEWRCTVPNGRRPRPFLMLNADDGAVSLAEMMRPKPVWC